MAAIKEYPFPPKALALSDLLVEPSQALSRMTQLVTGPEGVEPRCSGLALTQEDEGLAWRGVVDVPGKGFHTLVLGATDGRVLLSKFSHYAPG